MSLSRAISGFAGFLSRPLVFVVLMLLLPVAAARCYQTCILVGANGSPLTSQQVADPVRPIQSELIRISRIQGWQDDPELLKRFNELERDIRNRPDPRYRHFYSRSGAPSQPVTREELERLDW